MRAYKLIVQRCRNKFEFSIERSDREYRDDSTFYAMSTNGAAVIWFSEEIPEIEAVKTTCDRALVEIDAEIARLNEDKNALKDASSRFIVEMQNARPE